MDETTRHEMHLLEGRIDEKLDKLERRIKWLEDLPSHH